MQKKMLEQFIETLDNTDPKLEIARYRDMAAFSVQVTNAEVRTVLRKVLKKIGIEPWEDCLSTSRVFFTHELNLLTNATEKDVLSAAKRKLKIYRRILETHLKGKYSLC